jgi:hypothetical protein
LSSQWYRCTISTKTSWPLLISSAGKCLIFRTLLDCWSTECCMVRSFPQMSEHRETLHINVRFHSWCSHETFLLACSFCNLYHPRTIITLCSHLFSFLIWSLSKVVSHQNSAIFLVTSSLYIYPYCNLPDITSLTILNYSNTSHAVHTESCAIKPICLNSGFHCKVDDDPLGYDTSSSGTYLLISLN